MEKHSPFTFFLPSWSALLKPNRNEYKWVNFAAVAEQSKHYSSGHCIHFTSDVIRNGHAYQYSHCVAKLLNLFFSFSGSAYPTSGNAETLEVYFNVCFDYLKIHSWVDNLEMREGSVPGVTWPTWCYPNKPAFPSAASGLLFHFRKMWFLLENESICDNVGLFLCIQKAFTLRDKFLTIKSGPSTVMVIWVFSCTAKQAKQNTFCLLDEIQ